MREEEENAVPEGKAVEEETVNKVDKGATAGRLMRKDAAQENVAAHCRPASWVGFLELEGWARAVDPARPVLLLPVVQPAGTRMSGGRLSHEDLVVCCQQVTAEGDVLYCRLRAATFTLEECETCPGGRAVLDADWPEKAMRWESLWACVEEDLAAWGLTVLPGTAAWPEGHRFLTGHANGIRYDPAARCFRCLPFEFTTKPDDGSQDRSI